MAYNANGEARISVKLVNMDRAGLERAISESVANRDIFHKDTVTWNKDGSVEIEWAEMARPHGFCQPLLDWLKDKPESLYHVRIDSDESVEEYGGAERDMSGFMAGMRFFHRLSEAAYGRLSEMVQSRVWFDGDICRVVPYGYDDENDPKGLLKDLADDRYNPDVSLDNNGDVAELCMRVANRLEREGKLGEIMDLGEDQAVRALAEGAASAIAQGPRPDSEAGISYDAAKSMLAGNPEIGYDFDLRRIYCDFRIKEEPKERPCPKSRLA